MPQTVNKVGAEKIDSKTTSNFLFSLVGCEQNSEKNKIMKSRKGLFSVLLHTDTKRS